MCRTPTPPRPASRWAWLAVAALLLQAAVPMLASVSARLQDKALVEICTGYGVATVALADGGPDSHAPAPIAAPHADHCTLSLLLALAVPAAPGAVPIALAQRAAAPVGSGALLPGDASARWAAALQHGPPASA